MSGAIPPDFRWVHDSEAGPLPSGKLRSLLQIMQQFNAVSLFSAMSVFGHLVPNGARPGAGLRMPTAHLTLLLGELDSICEEQRRLELMVSLAITTEINVYSLRGPELVSEFSVDVQKGVSPQWYDIKPHILEAAVLHINHLHVCMTNELRSRLFFGINSSHARYYEHQEPLFGQKVADKFSSLATSEIDEAGKCSALRRYTACVFHMMRVMETGIRAVAKCLGVPDPVKEADRNWGKMLGSIKVEIDKRNKNPHGWTVKDDKVFFEDAYTSLDAVKNAWRNPTMHVEKTYGEEQASNIFEATREFMMKLADRCDENGEPKS